MKSEDLFLKYIDKKYFIFPLLFLGAYLRIIYLIELDDYYDDWNFFFTVDPNISYEDTWVRYFGYRQPLGSYNIDDWNKVGEDFPYYFAFLTKYILMVIGYSVEKVHYFLLFFSICSLIVVTKISDLFTSDLNFKILTLFLFITNLYLIKDINALRPHALTIFLTLLSLYYFILIYFKNKITYKNIFCFSLITLCYLLIWPLNLSFFAGQLVVLSLMYFNNSFKNTKVLILPSIIIIIIYLILNFHYLNYQVIDKSEHYTPFQIKFFTNYFFNIFFGSIYFGGLMLLMFTYFGFNFFKKKLKKNKFNFILFFKEKKIEDSFLIIIITIYILIILYSIFRAPVMAAKYVPFLVPIIIFWISYKIYSLDNKIIYYGIILFSILNIILFWGKIQIDRPPIKEVLNQLKESDTKQIFTTEGAVFNHFLNNYDLSLKNNLEFKKFEENNSKFLPKEFWFLCLNNARFRIGENQLPDDEKCYSFKRFDELNLVKTIRLPDILIHKIKKNIK